MSKQTATIYRIKTDKHICPHGLRALALLKKNNFLIVDNQLRNKEEADAFKAQHHVKTTPQIFIDDKRIGGFSDLEIFLGEKSRTENKSSYRPIIMIFGATFLMACAMQTENFIKLNLFELIKDFFAFSMCVLAILKLKDTNSFLNQFITYDLLAMRFLSYGSLYPFLEFFVGLGMISGINPYATGLLSLCIGTIGAVSVVKAVYFEKRDLKCACVGGDSNVPLGAISLIENFMMIAMGFLAIGLL